MTAAAILNFAKYRILGYSIPCMANIYHCIILRKMFICLYILFIYLCRPICQNCVIQYR